MDNIIKIANEFKIENEIITAKSYGRGHINDTYRITDVKGKYYILQKINHFVFKDIKGLMKNIVSVTDYINNNIIAEEREQSLKVIKTKNGNNYYESDEGNFYRCYNFIYGAFSVEENATQNQFKLSGVGFGRFQKLLDGFNADSLVDTIPDFHNTVVRLNNFKKAVENKSDRLNYVKEEVQFYLDREEYCNKVISEIEKGTIPLRVTHNDTKINNLLIDSVHLKAVTVIDLDTVMKGSILYDFGDGIRSGATTIVKDNKEKNNCNFLLELFDSYAKGFLSEVGKNLTNKELELMAFSALLMTYECGMRFLTDYIEGDIYFKVKYDEHNLDRTHTQMKILKDMEIHLDEMNAIINKYIK